MSTIPVVHLKDVTYPAGKSNFPHTRSSLTFYLYFLVRSFSGTENWLWQLMDIFLLSMHDVMLGNQLVELVWSQFLVWVWVTWMQNTVDWNTAIWLTSYPGLKINRPRCTKPYSKNDRQWHSEMFWQTQENIRNTQLCFVFLRFPFVCQHISACLELSRPRSAIVCCYNIALWSLFSHSCLSKGRYSKKVSYFKSNFHKMMFGHSFLHKFECRYSENVWNRSFWMAALETKSRKLVEPTILCETTDRKIKEKKKESRRKRWLCLQGSCYSIGIQIDKWMVTLVWFDPDYFGFACQSGES